MEVFDTYDENESTKMNIIAMSFFLACSMIGAGTLTLNSSFSNMGWLLGFIGMLILAVITAVSLIILDENLNISAEKGSIAAIFNRYKVFRYFINVCIAVSGFLTTFYYYSLVIDFSMSLFNMLKFGPQIGILFNVLFNLVIIVFLLFLLLKNIKENKFTAYAMITSLSVVMLSLLGLLCYFGSTVNSIATTQAIWSLNAFKAFSNMVFAFSFQQTYPCLIPSLRNSNAYRRRISIVLAVSLGFVFYSIFGLLGYFLFGAVNSNIITSFTDIYYNIPDENKVEKILFFSFSIFFKLVFSFILLMAIVFQSIASKNSATELFKTVIRNEKLLSYGITIFQVSCFLIFGITQINPESFLSILGVFIEPFINFILPAIATIMFLRKRVYFLSSAIVLIVLTIGISGGFN
ncbi:hypothetical protein H311_01657 [Anncaliia algerae PRA109]|nr:hypothetical protein H311_01657 [Anncaliia algerae PRA109]